MILSSILSAMWPCFPIAPLEFEEASEKASVHTNSVQPLVRIAIRGLQETMVIDIRYSETVRERSCKWEAMRMRCLLSKGHRCLASIHWDFGDPNQVVDPLL